MVEQTDPEDLACRFDSRGLFAVFDRCRHIARRMVVDKDDARMQDRPTARFLSRVTSTMVAANPPDDRLNCPVMRLLLERAIHQNCSVG